MTSPGSPRVAAAAVPGCQHVLSGGLPCQDAVKVRISKKGVLLALADGHGDAAYPYSDEGARLAVAVAIDTLEAVLERASGDEHRLGDEAFEHDIALPFKRRVAFEWNRRVKHHARMIAEVQGKAPSSDLADVTGDWDEAVQPYGCTLLACAITPEFAIWLRLGDGDLLAVDIDGSRRVFAAPDKSMGQATFSLSMRDCVEHMRVRRSPASAEFVVLASDGVSDQYDANPTFEEEWGARMLERVHAKGWVDTVMELPKWLGTIAKDGDDCAVALAWFPRAART